VDAKSNRYLLSIFPKKDYFGLAFADLTTGECSAFECQGEEALKSELLRLNPAEIVVHREHYENPDFRALIIQLSEAPISPVDLYEEAGALLKETFHVQSLDAFGISGWPFAVQAAAVLMRYLLDTQKNELKHFDKITAFHRDQWMPLDEATLRNLELAHTFHGQQGPGTLLHVLDKTETSMGARLLKKWLLHPLVNGLEIELRQVAVENLVKENELRHHLRDQLKGLGDLERLLGRLSTGLGSARDLLGLGRSLSRIPEVQALLSKAQARGLLQRQEQMKALPDMVDHIERAILEEAPLKLTEGGLIRPGYHAELDELQGLMKDARSALKEIEQQEIQATGISSLKVRYNRVFGYYLEISKSNLDKVPDHYIRKQTLVNAERFITPELKEYEDKVLTAQERSVALEQELFLALRDEALSHLKNIKRNAQLLAELDVLLSFAEVAVHHQYVRPKLTDRPELMIQDGRHPVVESLTIERNFVPNDTQLMRDGNELVLLTGPNMSGKSTYLRQVALLVLLAQVGSFVPAKAMRTQVFDRIFTRVGASDNLAKGQSTFMVEMQESAHILNHATPKSLIILDEIGRGTSTYDGMSLAWAIFEYLHEEVRAFSLFATHYHELIPLADRLKRAKNNCVDVQETPKGVLFLHKIKEGGMDQSYGIEVAKLAGLPAAVVDRAVDILHDLEQQSHPHLRSVSENQLDLFRSSYARERQQIPFSHPALDRLKKMNINQLTPLEALNTLNELKLLDL
jgi:DNA mismatch repair protein MutS